MRPDRTFRRNFFVIATLHVAAVVCLYLFGSWHVKPPEQVLWLDGGSIGGGDVVGAVAPLEALPIPPPPPEPEPERVPIEAKPEPLPPPPPEPPAPSEIVMPKATPEPSTPKPSTPKPETPKPETPKPETPKPKPKATPTPKPKPKTTPKKKPSTPKASAEKKDAETKPKAAADAKKPASAAGSAKTNESTMSPTGGNGPGSGNGKGPGKTGSGTGASEFGWYFSMIHDRFHARWDQPTSIESGNLDIVTTLKLRISKDGTILSREIVRTSGDVTMDQSVMTAAERVQQIDPLPAGLGTGDVFEVNVAFKLDQGS